MGLLTNVVDALFEGVSRAVSIDCIIHVMAAALKFTAKHFFATVTHRSTLSKASNRLIASVVPPSPPLLQQYAFYVLEIQERFIVDCI